MSIALSSGPAFCAAVKIARTIDFAAYTLRPGAAREALLAAARSGAAVRVRLERDPLDDGAGSLHCANADSVAILRSAGVDAALRDTGEPPVHMKAAVVDGVAWLDDRNWTGARETIVRDDESDDVARLARSLRGLDDSNGADGAPPPHLATTKATAQALEAALIEAAGRASLCIESESFGNGAIYDALLVRAKSQLSTRLLVAGREATAAGPAGDLERRRLTRLAALGVDVRTGTTGGRELDEKIAVAGLSGWVGSANATYAGGADGEQRDWGLASSDAQLVDALRAAFEANWRAATVFSEAGNKADGGAADINVDVAPADSASAVSKRLPQKIDPPDAFARCR